MLLLEEFNVWSVDGCDQIDQLESVLDERVNRFIAFILGIDAFDMALELFFEVEQPLHVLQEAVFVLM